ncbi:MMPL family transporter [Azospirillum sp. TSO22-1]|uniref:efflux RND transporter permease subunit n=1 Tax=Azospirillum sp. TSO22-1 TaxID=716789 RepID=UPI000D613862|nr:MMPL family transporter [Azospirillum sp. TSO22-1]PWC52534.1 RND transporter [Azospirillum sp. TSO22-1]
MLQRIATLIIRFRLALLLAMAAASTVVAWFATQIQVRTDLADLLPRDHAYVAVDRAFRTSFGSANMVSVMLEVRDGTIFRADVLRAVQGITRELEYVKGVNPFQINSLAARKMVEVRADDKGIETRPLMWPEVPEEGAGIEALKRAVLSNPLVFGRYVSADLGAALITADFYGNAIDHQAVFAQVGAILERYTLPGVTVHVVGEPVLYGWVEAHLPETIAVFAATMLLTAFILFVTSRSLRGTLLPLLAGLASAVWALGFARMLGFSFDPLVVVVAFLISARSVSHSVQVVAHFDDRVLLDGLSPPDAARSTITDLFKPGTLGVLTDAGGIAIVALTPIPLLEKVAIIGCIWVATILVTSVLLTPILLSYVPTPVGHRLRADVSPLLNRLLDGCARLALGRRRAWVPVVAAVIFAGSFAYSFHLSIGDASAGSPILWSDSPYNRAAAAINARFHGADRMFIVVAGSEPDAIKRPEVLKAMRDLQRFMEAQPEIGATVSIADLIPAINRTIHEGNPRYQDLPDDRLAIGEMLYFFGTGLDASDTALFFDAQYRNASITAFFTDRRGDTVATAIGRIKRYLAEHPVPDVEFRLAGGVVGNTAAINEIILGDQIRSIALALLVVVACCLLAYRDAGSGIVFMVPVLLSNTVTFCLMAAVGIGMNINTLPVAALGIGLGVDYAFYVVDRIREELARGRGLNAALHAALRGSGRAVLITGVTLCLSVFVWSASSLKFQAEMGLLMGVWLLVSATAALVLMPALVVVFKPAFVVGARRSGNGRPAADEALAWKCAGE